MGSMTSLLAATARPTARTVDTRPHCTSWFQSHRGRLIHAAERTNGVAIATTEGNAATTLRERMTVSTTLFYPSVFNLLRWHSKMYMVRLRPTTVSCWGLEILRRFETHKRLFPGSVRSFSNGNGQSASRKRENTEDWKVSSLWQLDRFTLVAVPN